MLRTNLWTITMQNVSGIKKWNYEKLPLNFAMQFPFPFPVIPGNNNVSFPFPKCGNGISIPVPKNWEWNFPVPVPKSWEWKFSFPFPFPKVGNAIHHSRSRSQILGMGWAIPVPVPKCPKVIPAHPCPLPWFLHSYSGPKEGGQGQKTWVNKEEGKTRNYWNAGMLAPLRPPKLIKSAGCNRANRLQIPLIVDTPFH